MKAVVALAAVAAVAHALHYEKPPCGSDEIAGNIKGAIGTLCAPKCDAEGKCPMDVPQGTWHNATPACILSDQTGQKYCALTCVLVGCPTGAHCAMLAIVKGVCVYPNGTRTDPLPAKNLIMNPEKPAVTHPSLPTMWTALAKEDEVGIVHESEHFVAKSNEKNVSAKWTNYTDGSCQRLIREGAQYDQMRYLLGCDAVDCCSEDGDGPLEYQIPNIHPAFLAPVTYVGKETITLFDKSTVQADHWQWKFMIAKYNVWTTTAADGTGILHRWQVDAGSGSYPNDYVKYTPVPAEQESSFLATFNVPDICKGAQSCASLHKEGKLSDKSIKFLRQGKKGIKPTTMIV